MCSQPFQNEGPARGSGEGGRGLAGLKWQLFIDPCTKCLFIWGTPGGWAFDWCIPNSDLSVSWIMTGSNIS